MTSVFSSMVWPSRSPTRPSPSRSTNPSSQSSSSPSDDSSDPVEPDLRDLNTGLQALVDIFPDIQPEVFREMLSTFSEESRLQVITETLLKHAAKYVRGRYRTPAEQGEQHPLSPKYKYRSLDPQKDTRGIPLALEDTFRSQCYKDAAKEALYREFSGLSHSTIKAVLAEWNWSYTHARETLLVLASKSWRASFASFFLRRKMPTATDHPLVVWTSADAKMGRPGMPLLVSTKSRELDKELYDTLILPELEKQRKEQIAKDFELAVQWNETEAEEAGEVYDCECCFIPNTLAQMSTCDVEGHYICFSCIRHSISAALYDQGWARNIDPELCTLRCVAPLPQGPDDQCSGCVPMHFIERALLEERDGADNFRKLNERFASEALLKSHLPLIRCPFCSYAEIDALALPRANLFSTLKIRRGRLLLASVPLLELLCWGIFRLILQFALLTFTSMALLGYISGKPLNFTAPIDSALRRIHLRRRGLRFQCLSPSCGRQSCLSCSGPWHDPHACYSSQLQSLRLTLERATTDAVKRTCPDCNLAFVKSEGCNKLVCLCGYSMCYLCRQGLATEGYNHFCQHFREIPGRRCMECDRCDLYQAEDEEEVVRSAREVAEREWWERQGEGKGHAQEKDLKRGLAENEGLKGWGVTRKLPVWEVWLERAIEALVV